MTITSTYHLENKRIFLIEDDVLNLAIINRVLINSKATVFQNYNSIGIVTHIIQHLPIDLILLDIMLRRGVSGMDVILELKNNMHTANIPVVAVSALDPEIAIPQAQRAGFNGFIGKPINSMSFSQDIAAIIHGEQRWVAS
ncbi:MAG TPA: response regulator [Anaerolineales bacterium]|nr:response regulator [Anaerolineales bacterium]